MEKRTQIPDYSSFEKYMFGAEALRMLDSEENKRYAPNALEVLAGKKGLNLGEEAEGFIRGTQASEKGIQTAADIYSKKFYEEKIKYSPSGLIEWYAPLFKGLDDKEKDKIVEILSEHKETLGSIMEKQKRANHILTGKDMEGLYSKAQIDEAKKIAEKYQKVSLVLGILDNYKFESIRPDVIDVARKQDLKELASKL